MNRDQRPTQVVDRFEFPLFWLVAGSILAWAVLASSALPLLLLVMVPILGRGLQRALAFVAERRAHAARTHVADHTDVPPHPALESPPTEERMQYGGFEMLRSIAPRWTRQQDLTFLGIQVSLTLLLVTLHHAGIMGGRAVISVWILAVPLISWAAAELSPPRMRRAVSAVSLTFLTVGLAFAVVGGR